MAISSPLKSNIQKSPTTTVKKFETILFNRTRVKKEIFQNKTILQNRRVENERRVQAEEELEAPNIAVKRGGAAQLISGSAKGFFERIIGFLGYLSAGWIINNLPRWISEGKEFIARTQQMGKILGNFIENTTNIFKDFTRLLVATLSNIISFDFLDTSGRVSSAFDDLTLSVDNWGTGFEDAIKLITTPLTEGIASGEDAPSTGTQNTDEGAYERTAPYSGSGGSTTTYSSTGGKKISKSEFGNRGFRTRDGLGSGATPFGHTGRDVPMPEGTPLSIVPPGVVVEASTGYNNGYGNLVTIKLDDGRYIKINHLSAILVKAGDKVGTGSGKDGGVRVVGKVGSTGFSTGSHMHLDIGTGYNKGPAQITGLMDPDSFIINGGVVRGGNVKSTGEVKQSNSPTSQPQQPLVGTSPPSSSGSGRFGTKEQKAMLDSIAFAEGTSKYQNDGYNTMFTGKQFSGFKDHPRKLQTGGGYTSDAAGRYQFLSTTWDPLAKKLGLEDFSPTSQDKAAIELSRQYDVTQELLQKEGMSMKVSSLLGRQWASFPGKTIGMGQPTQELKGIQNVYQKSLGSPQQLSQTQTQSPAPAQTQSPAPTQAQITPTGTPQNQQVNQSLTPERKGQTVIVSQNPSQQPQQTMPYGGGGGSSGGGSSPQTNEFTLLNIFMKNKLLLDLAYL